jgi:hypothetical protein
MAAEQPPRLPGATDRPIKVDPDSTETEILRFVLGLALARYVPEGSKVAFFRDVGRILLDYYRRRVGADFIAFSDLAPLLASEPLAFLCASKVLPAVSAQACGFGEQAAEYRYTCCAFADWADADGALCSRFASILEAVAQELIVDGRIETTVVPHFRGQPSGVCECRIRFLPFQHLRLVCVRTGGSPPDEQG